VCCVLKHKGTVLFAMVNVYLLDTTWIVGGFMVIAGVVRFNF
jgi:hypothetical protein